MPNRMMRPAPTGRHPNRQEITNADPDRDPAARRDD